MQLEFAYGYSEEAPRSLATTLALIRSSCVHDPTSLRHDLVLGPNRFDSEVYCVSFYERELASRGKRFVVQAIGTRQEIEALVRAAEDAGI